jgi:hypothetical protein
VLCRSVPQLRADLSFKQAIRDDYPSAAVRGRPFWPDCAGDHRSDRARSTSAGAETLHASVAEHCVRRCGERSWRRPACRASWLRPSRTCSVTPVLIVVDVQNGFVNQDRGGVEHAPRRLLPCSRSGRTSARRRDRPRAECGFLILMVLTSTGSVPRVVAALVTRRRPALLIWPGDSQGHQ